MKNAPAIHLAIIQPAGYVHSLGFLDQARYFRTCSAARARR